MKITDPGNFVVGCNYWASHAGTAMWHNWDEGAIRRDFELMKSIGLQLVRVFPLWPDFQPLELHRTVMGYRRELQLLGQPLPETEAGRAGVSELMMDRFRILAGLAESCGIKLLVPLVTGWMSGELHVPPAFCNMNMLTDPLALKWETAFVRYFVRSFKDHPAIVAWELGNECNCMALVDNREQAWLWTNTISSAIRLEDTSRPVASGMHGIHPGSEQTFNPWKPNNWLIREQGDLCDLMTSHPYPHSPSKKPARVDPVGSMRGNFQAVVESRMYADMGGKPCLVEEIGTFGPMVCNEETAGRFIHSVLWNAWAHDCRGLLWWCGFDQIDLEHSPYNWNAWERELGLFRRDATMKPVAETLKKFRMELEALPFKSLPPFRKEAVCLLTHGMNADEYLENAWSSFVLAKQAGFDLEFRFVNEPLPERQLYIIPGIQGSESLSRSQLFTLMEKVKAGATLYCSLDGGHLAPFNRFFGLSVINRCERKEEAVFSLDNVTFRCGSQYRLELASEGADIIAEEPDGNPAFTCYSYGQGKVWLMTSPVERHLAETPDAFSVSAPTFYRFYQKFAAEMIAGRLVRRSNAFVSVTEHFMADDQAVVVLFNHHSALAESSIEFKSGWHIAKVLSGTPPEAGRVMLAPRQVTILMLAQHR